MIKALQSEETVLASAYAVGVQAREKNYPVCSTWKDMIRVCMLNPGQKYHHIRLEVRKQFAKGYRNE